MKKIISLVLVLAFVFVGVIACNKTNEETNNETPSTEKTYTLALAVDTAIKGTKVTNTTMALVLDTDNKIVAARVDCVEATPALDAEGALVPQTSVATKVELGDAYSGMPAGSWAKQAEAFEKWLVGKTAADVAGAEITNELVAGCTMISSMTTFKALVAEAFATANKVEFKTADAVSVGLALDTTVKSNKITTDIAVVAIASGKVVATALDSIEQSFSIENGTIVAGELSASKAELGDAYAMTAGSWIKQAKAFAASTVGKTVAELNDLETVSDALVAAGCTMQYTTAGYKATIIKAAGLAK